MTTSWPTGHDGGGGEQVLKGAGERGDVEGGGGDRFNRTLHVICGVPRRQAFPGTALN